MYEMSLVYLNRNVWLSNQIPGSEMQKKDLRKTREFELTSTELAAVLKEGLAVIAQVEGCR